MMTQFPQLLLAVDVEKFHATRKHAIFGEAHTPYCGTFLNKGGSGSCQVIDLAGLFRFSICGNPTHMHYSRANGV
eukprot:snap_masked-scaffold_1-processed-gene-17.24-mRNA-1 protein AED:1.00 eAED:1.00 QI:0/-1/0/0/-1/1/1/0/74